MSSLWGAAEVIVRLTTTNKLASFRTGNACTKPDKATTILFGHVPDQVHDAARAVPLAAVPVHAFTKVLSSMLPVLKSVELLPRQHSRGGLRIAL